jgi:hypothetical protein
VKHQRVIRCQQDVVVLDDRNHASRAASAWHQTNAFGPALVSTVAVGVGNVCGWHAACGVVRCPRDSNDSQVNAFVGVLVLGLGRCTLQYLQYARDVSMRYWRSFLLGSAAGWAMGWVMGWG